MFIFGFFSFFLLNPNKYDGKSSEKKNWWNKSEKYINNNSRSSSSNKKNKKQRQWRWLQMWWLCDNVDVSVCSSIHLVNSHEQNIKARNLNIKNSRNEMQSFLNKQNRERSKGDWNPFCVEWMVKWDDCVSAPVCLCNLKDIYTNAHTLVCSHSDKRDILKNITTKCCRFFTRFSLIRLQNYTVLVQHIISPPLETLSSYFK